MQKIAISLSNGNKIVEKLEIKSVTELHNLFNHLKLSLVTSTSYESKSSQEDVPEEKLATVEVSCDDTKHQSELIADTDGDKAEQPVFHDKDETAYVPSENIHKIERNISPFSRDAFFIMKCPKCGKMKCFRSNTNTTFHCGCGETYATENYVEIHGKCPNCSNNIGTRQGPGGMIVATLEGMDITEGMKCNRCESPVNFFHNKVKNIWVDANMHHKE